MSQCKCSMSISVLGDGCRYCQPQECIDRLSQILDDERSDHLASHAYDEAKERALFEGEFPYVSHFGSYDSWVSRWKYTHEAVDSLWFGWLACAKARAKAAGGMIVSSAIKSELDYCQEDAACARKSAEIKHYGEFTR